MIRLPTYRTGHEVEIACETVDAAGNVEEVSLRFLSLPSDEVESWRPFYMQTLEWYRDRGLRGRPLRERADELAGGILEILAKPPELGDGVEFEPSNAIAKILVTAAPGLVAEIGDDRTLGEPPFSAAEQVSLSELIAKSWTATGRDEHKPEDYRERARSLRRDLRRGGLLALFIDWMDAQEGPLEGKQPPG